MPRRPREHQLETESRVAFHAAIPSAWVCRDLNEDYGIDAEVELFDAKGEATGEKFLVQLKATDESALAKALRVSIPVDTAKYYDSLRLPVLVVRYVASSRTLYACWFHAFEFGPMHEDQQTVTLKFFPDHQWHPDTPAALALDVASFRQLRAPILRGDVTIAVDMQDGAYGVRRFELVSKLRQASDEFQRIRFESRHAERYVSNVLRIDNQRIEVILAGGRRFLLTTGPDYPSDCAEDRLHLDCLACVAIALGTFGHAFEASNILAKFSLSSNLVSQEGPAIAIASCLARTNHQATLIAIAEALLERGHADAAIPYLVTFFGMHRRLNDKERLHGLDLVFRLGARLLENGDAAEAARMYYNAGSMLRDLEAQARALRAYRQAAKVDLSYLQRPYFWAELAGMLFIRKRFTMSAKLYRRSLDLQDDDGVACRYADALLFSGHYADAVEIWSERLGTITEETATWFLKLRAAEHIIGITRMETQKRRPAEAFARFPRGEPSDAEIANACRDAIALDAMCNLAWFNLAGVMVRANRMREAAEAYVVAAVAASWDLEAWGNVIASAHEIGDNHLEMLAHIAGGVQQRQYLTRELAARAPTEHAEEYAERLDDVVQTLPQPWRRATIRPHNVNDGTWFEVVSDDTPGHEDDD